MKKKRLVTLSLSILIIGAVVAAFIAMKNAPAQTGAWQQSPRFQAQDGKTPQNSS